MAESGLVKVIRVADNHESTLSSHNHFLKDRYHRKFSFAFALVCFVVVVVVFFSLSFLRHRLQASCFKLHSIRRFAGLMETLTPTVTVYKEHLMLLFILRCASVCFHT